MIQTVLTTIYHVSLPLSLPVLGGWLLKKYQKLDTKPLLTLSLYLLSPALIFNALMKAEISTKNIFEIAGFSFSMFMLLWIIAYVTGLITKISTAESAGLTLISMFSNSVNYGLPLILLVFGQIGLDYASVFVIIQMIIINTVGVFIAARSHFSVRNAILSVFKLPAIYAAVLAFVFQIANLQVPEGIDTGISLIANSYAPLVLSILGAQMASVENAVLTKDERKAFWSGLGVRFLLVPLLAFFVLSLFKIEGILFSVLFLLTSIPAAAVNAAILAEKFEASPKVVSKCILWTTLSSFVLVPILIVISNG